MESLSQRFLITFNGEIYNSDLYKNRLLSRGVKFYTTSDTEVLMNALIHLGIKKVLDIKKAKKIGAKGVLVSSILHQNKLTKLFIQKEKTSL